MRGLFLFLVILSLIGCNNSSSNQNVEKTNKVQLSQEAKKHEKKVDTTLASLGDSLKADWRHVKTKIKEHAQELTETANKGVNKIKQEAKKIKSTAKAESEGVK
ncbi:hypothetical protein PIECOFPK_02632 [Mycovorax composti]|jgi:hypothetical protein|uniref:Lipoprotein n=2 Tax=Chitinophagaceae TaxID=563835 RepID=A0ABZ2ENA3_9BACT